MAVQNTDRNSSVVVIGLGALGSHTVPLIRNLKNRIVLVDFDKVEPKNLLAQNFSVEAMDKNKAKAMALRMRSHRVSTTEIPHRLTSVNCESLMGGASLVLDCTDNKETRALIQDFCSRSQIPCLHGAVSQDGSFGKVFWDNSFTPDQEQEGVPTCEDGANLPFLGIMGAYLAYAVVAYLGQGKRDNYMVTLNGVFKV